MNEGPDRFEVNGQRDFCNLYTATVYRLVSLQFFLKDSKLRYDAFLVGLSAAGLLVNRAFYSFHLLDLILKIPTINEIVKHIVDGGKQLLAISVILILGI